MSLGTGAFVRAAKSHESAGMGCQDAALSIAQGSRALAIVCDGCSAGVDSGACAALLASAGRAAWLAGSELGWGWGQEAWGRASAAMDMAGMAAQGSPATLLAAELDGDSGELRVAMWGDGALALIGADGEALEIWVGESALNMPAYPAYAFDARMWAAFENAGGCSTWARSAGDDSRLSAQAGQDGRFWQASGRLEEGEMILLLSDGIGAVEGRSIEQCVADLASARGPGGFIERRARKAVESWRAQGASLGDDFSVAALRMPEGAKARP